ncbi:oligopeptidase A-like isoform X1 [Daktulosphaira vitifoliae]|uniref:oligopeptidase A-like isoform X1 n=1 Tax=Daktulosphaira vitifoliae TaxID=58002 RepID=UPI0021AA96AB|nr:oligopeptidase A-like isoform X1 [Daktulosphaira vitifoliae]
MSTKMASSTEEIENTLSSILEKARPLQEKEIELLQEFSNKRGNEYPIQLWDVPYWARLQMKNLYGYDEVLWSEYFPLDRVLDGLFNLCNKLFGIRILEMPNKVNMWHPDVKYYEILREDEPTIMAGFYLDLCTRPNKMRSVGEPGWIVTHRTASSIPKKVLPLAALIMNMPSSQNKVPSLLSFNQVKTLFGKFGHLLQNLLCQVHYAEVSGLNNVEWDAIGITSNFMKHWLYDKDTFESLNSHYKTGKRLPGDQLTEIKQHMAGFNTCEELYKSMLDLKMHTTIIVFKVQILKIYKNI